MKLPDTSCMPERSLHFLLVPDRASARMVRREVATAGARLGVLVGTWPELVELALENSLTSLPDNAWDETLSRAAHDLTDTFWAGSLEVAPRETLSSLNQALCLLLEGAGPGRNIEAVEGGGLPRRTLRHLTDLARLHSAMGEILPPALAGIDALLRVKPDEDLRSIVVYRVEGMPRLSPWQSALVKRLSGDGLEDHDPELLDILGRSLSWTPTGDVHTALGAIQARLFESSDPQLHLDATAQWIGVRDSLEEVEVAAGMIQNALAGDTTLAPADIGLLVPYDNLYRGALRDVFTWAGLALSGLSAERTMRDLGREAVLYFLISRHRPAPSMALASLVTSPLMPWTTLQGYALAREIMNGRFDLKPAEDITSQGREMLRLLGNAAADAKRLPADLERFASLLHTPEGLEHHMARARATIAEVIPLARKDPDTAMKEMLLAASPETLSQRRDDPLSREGIAVFHEHEEPWRRVRRLYVLGFASGHYPLEAPVSPVFSESDLEMLRDRCGYAIESGSDSSSRRRQLFLRQVRSTSDSITFFIPRRDDFGEPLSHSQTLPFMACLFKGVGEPGDIVRDLDRQDAAALVTGLALAEPSVPVPPRPLAARDPSLGQDLLLIGGSDGAPRPQSPSALETLMVSPLAWLVMTMGLEPADWEPDTLDAPGKGTLAHYVFEYLFKPDAAVPDEEEIMNRAPALLNEAIITVMPFLLGPEWHVERSHLLNEIERAAIRWAEFLKQTMAQVLGNEVWLQGMFDDLPVRGRTDLLLRLPRGRVYVVDYKKSSGKSYRDRMKKGFDSQASLYRIMLKTGKASGREGSRIAEELGRVRDIGVLYYLMNDQVTLTDSDGWIDRQVPGVEELGGGVSKQALALIRERVMELRAGIVRLNYEDEADTFEKRTGIKPYALDRTPLIRLFTHPGSRGER